MLLRSPVDLALFGREDSSVTSGIKESNPKVVGYRIRFVASFLGRFVREGLLSEN